jgi:hypothetical protein
MTKLRQKNGRSDRESEAAELENRNDGANVARKPEKFNRAAIHFYNKDGAADVSSNLLI